MALLRPCGRFARALCQLPVRCQIEYIRGVVCFARSRGYVTIGPRASYANNNIEKSLTNDSVSATNRPPAVRKLKAHLGRRLLSLCRSANNGKIRSEDLLQLLESTSAGKNSSGETLGLDLLRYCGQRFYFVNANDRRRVVDQIWTVMREKLPALSLQHYNCLLRVHIENSRTVDPKIFLESMTVKPDETTYLLLLELASENGNVQSVRHIFDAIKDAGYVLNNKMFNALVRAYVNKRNIKLALSTLETMREARVEPNTDTYSWIACCYAASGDIDNTMKIMNAHPLGVENIVGIMKHLSQGRLSEYIPKVLDFLPSPVNKHLAVIVDTIKSLIETGYLDDAFEMVNCLVAGAPTEDTDPILEVFLKNTVYAKYPSAKILDLAGKIMKMKQYSFALHHVGEAALQIGENDLAMAVFEAMHDNDIQVRPHYYWPIFRQSSESGGETEVFRILKHMRCLDVQVDHDTLYTNVLPRISIVDPLVALRKLNDAGIEISKIFTPLICYLLMQGRLKEVGTLCYKIRAPIDFTKVIQPLVSAYKSSRNVNDCARIFKFARRQDRHPDAMLKLLFGTDLSPRNLAAFNDFIRAFGKLGIPVDESIGENSRRPTEGIEANDASYSDTMEAASSDPRETARIPHPSEMNVEELECHLIELRAKGMNDRGVLRKLLQLHCRRRNPERVEEIRNELEESGCPWTPGMFSSLLQFYAQEGNPLEALYLYNHLRKNYNEFQIDDYKIIMLANSLVVGNYMSEAIGLIETNRASARKNVSKDCWRLLNSLAHSPSSDLTESMLDVLVNNGYCERRNSTLGPLVREHLVKNDLAAAVETYKKCVTLYKCTPLRQELINALVASMNTNDEAKKWAMQALSDIQRESANIYGNFSVNIDLLLALARNGRTEDLRKLLKKYPVTDDALIQSLRHTPEELKPQILMAVLDASAGIEDTYRCSLYEYTLAMYSRSGDCQGALELWRRMSSDNATASNKFMNQFADLLQMHKVPLPEDFKKEREV